VAREIEDAGWKPVPQRHTLQQSRLATCASNTPKSEIALIERVREALASKLPGDSKLLELRDKREIRQGLTPSWRSKHRTARRDFSS
jgi:hypothetical protein